MKRLIWSPAIALILVSVAVPGGIVLFALPLLALGYFVLAVIAVTGSEEHHATLGARARREQHQPASQATERISDESTKSVETSAQRLPTTTRRAA
jgi:hypothetical protein